jgi:predicted Zn-dependent peptidase
MKLMKFWLVILMAVSIQSLSAQGKFEWKDAVSGGYAYKYVTNDPMKARFYTLKNGLTVVLSVNKKEPRISVKIPVRAGSNTDPKDHTGLAHYLEHLLFKGTDKFGTLDWAKEKPLLDQIDGLYEQYNHTTDSAKRKEIYRQIDKVSGEASKYAIANEYDKLMAAMGAQGTNAHTWVEETVYEEDIPANALNKFLTVQAERFRNPILRIFHTELEAVYEEKNRSLDNDGSKANEAMYAGLFPTHNYGQQTTIGTIEHLKNPSLNAIRDYYYKYYVPNNMAIVLVGDLDPDATIKMLDEKFSYMKPKPIDEYKPAQEKALVGPVVKEVFGPSAESLRIGYRTAGADTRDELLADLLSSVLSNGKAGLLDLNLNKQQKLLGANAGVRPFKDYGIFILLASPKQGQTLEQAKDLLMEQIDIVKKGNFDESLIKSIVSNEKLAQLQGIENNDNRASIITDVFIKSKGLGWKNAAAQQDEMAKVSKKELVEFANKFFADNNYVIIYKRKGVDKNIVKVDKPTITPVETNAGKQSPFVKQVNDMPLLPVKPVFLDFNKDLQKSKAGKADVLYVQNKDNSLFRLYYKFNIGSYNNKLLPLALQYLQFLNTDKYTAEQISKEFYNLACNYNINAGTEESMASITGLQENFDKAVSLFEYLIKNCKEDDAALEGLKNRLAKSRTNSKLNKAAIIGALRSYGIYGAKNPTNYTLTDAEIKNLKAADLVAILHGMLNNEHKIIYYGPQALPAFTSNIVKIHTVPAIWAATTPAVKFDRIRQTKNEVLFADYDMVQAEIYWLRTLDNYDAKKEATVNLFNGYFGAGSMGAIVFQTIRESKALAYSTGAVLQTPAKKEDPYAFLAYVGTQADKLNEAIVGMNELLNDLPKNEQSLSDAKKSMVKDLETERISNDNIIFTYLANQKKGIDYDLRKDIYAQAGSLTFDDLKKLHNSSISQKPFTYTIVASEKKVKMEDLKKYGEVKKLSLEELFGY